MEKKKHYLSDIFDSNKKKIEKKTVKSDITATEKYLQEIKRFESDRNEFKDTLIKIGFGLAGFFGFTTILILAVYLVHPVMVTEPFLVRVDNSTGHTDIIKPLSDGKSVTYGEVLDKYWLRTYIKNRNSYEWESIQNNFNIVKLMSSNNVFVAYSSFIVSEKSPVNTFEDKRLIEVSKIDVTFLPDISPTSKIAQIKFQIDVKTAQGLSVVGYKPTHWAATVTFDYKSDIKSDDGRKLNPLGFRVTSYREDRVSS